VFKVTTNGALATLVSFSGTNGQWPITTALALGNDGNFYGTSDAGGTNVNGSGYGTVFQVTTNGTLTTLVFFNSTNGANPWAGLTLGNDGNFYGTTSEGGSEYGYEGYGTVFKVTTNGTLTTLVSFNETNGASPEAALTLGPDGCFYGTTSSGGSSNYGTVFKVATNGTLTTLVSFNVTNGAGPDAALTPGPDGIFYGTTRGGGTNGGYGTVFKVTTNGTLNTLYSFTGGSDGAYPSAGLTLGNDGNFYGTTYSGGIANSSYFTGMGTVFQVTTNGTLTTVVSFDDTNGAWPWGALTLGNDGNFYGTTLQGGASEDGTVFRLLLPPPLITVQPQSQTNHAGATVTFLVSATGLDSMVYQWQENGTNLVDGGDISGATTSTLTITGIKDSDAANYSVIISNFYGAVTSSNAVLTVNDLPFIASQPQSQTVGVGSNVTFSVTVYGAPPFVFDWYFNGKTLGSSAPGTNFSSCALTNVGTAQAGNYSVLVVNDYGSLLSSNAVLTVQVFPPTITVQPSSQNVMIGSSASFNVSVTGTAPFHYQWRFNGTTLLNATNAAYAIQAVAATNTGNYSVVVTNSSGSATSSNALLTVIIPPSVTVQFWAGYPLLDLSGMLSSNFVVQYSTNLAGANWMHLLSLTNLPSSPYLFLDSGGIGQPARFYRAFMQ
jgi:uncharacterized repeat protein (TIGR03803 family)